MDKTTLRHEVANSLVLLDEELRSFVANVHAGTLRKATHNLYYAAFDAACALLWTKGIRAETHESAQSMIALHFVKPGVLPKATNARLNELMSARHAADCQGAVSISRSDVRRYRDWAIPYVRQVLELIASSRLDVDLEPVRASLEAGEGVVLAPGRKRGS
ncbi:MAG: HEPN domain-containing protein [Burkholderiales bacterium]